MPLPLLMALSILAAQADQPVAPPPDAMPPASTADASTDTDDIPSNAPTDDFGFVSWCYGALDEYLGIYPKVLEDLKAIDKTVGSPVKEATPYSADVALEKKALKRFGDAIQAAEKAYPNDVDAASSAAVTQGRSIWSKAEAMPSRKLADAWLFWGIPVRCETTAKSLHAGAVAQLSGHPDSPPAKTSE